MAAQGRLERRAPGKRLCESAFDGLSLLQRIRKQQQLLLPIPTSSCAIVSAATLVRENIFSHAFRVEHEVVFLSKQCLICVLLRDVLRDDSYAKVRSL